MKYYWMVHVPGSETSKMHDSQFSAEEEARRIAPIEGKEVTVLMVIDTFYQTTPELVSHKIDDVLALLAKDTSLVSGIVYGLLDYRKTAGVATIKMPAGVVI